MKKYTFLLNMVALGLMLCVTTVNAQNDVQKEEPKLADYLEAMTTGPAQANDNNSTWEKPVAHKPGPHEAAYRAWQKYCEKMSAPGANPAVVKAQMKEVLASESAPVDVKVWMIKQFQWLGQEADLPALVPFLTAKEDVLRAEAISAISKIPGQKAIDALKKASGSANDKDKKQIETALAQQKLDFTIPVETEMPLALPYVSAAEVEKYLKDYDSFSVEKKIGTLGILAVRGDKKHAQYALSAMAVEEKGEEADALRNAGIAALIDLGSTKDIPALFEYAKRDGGRAGNTAVLIVADGFDAELQKYAKSEDDNVATTAIAWLAGRYVDVLPQILERIKRENCKIRTNLIRTAGNIATKNDVPALTDALQSCALGHERDSLEALITRLCAGDSTLALAKKLDPNLTLSLLGRIGDEPAMKFIEENLNKPQFREMAYRGLANLPHAKLAGKMLEMVDNKDTTDEQKIMFLRGYIRVVSLPENQIGIADATPAKRLAMLKEGFRRATRVDEKKLVLQRLSAIRTVDSAKFAMESFNTPELAIDAYRAFLDLAHHNYLRRLHIDVFNKGLDLVIEKCTDPGLVARAKEYRSKM